MRILLISDIHSNIEALKAILNKEKDFDLLAVAGDLVDYGTNPAECVEFFMNYKKPLALVHGNHDTHLINIYRNTDWKNVTGKDFKWVHENCWKLGEEHVSFLESLPDHLCFEADGWKYMIQHQYDSSYGIIESFKQFDNYWDEFSEYSGDYSRRRLIFGHSHRQTMSMLFGEREWINPGSISYRRPDDPDKEAHYAIIEDGKVEFRRTAYDRSVQFKVAQEHYKMGDMMETELQDFYFFFGPAKTSRDPLKIY